MTVVLELPKDLEQWLSATADSQKVSLEDATLIALREKMEGEQHREKVRKIGEYVERKNAELYRRLA